MDIVSHALWSGAAALALRRFRPVTRKEVAATIVAGIAPDIVQALPVLFWSLSQAQPVAVLLAFVVATPGGEPHMPDMVRVVANHLHCIGHSAVIAGTVSAAIWRWRRSAWIPLLGWWLHIAIDVPTHSNEYYGVPVLYPFSDWTFDGVAWIDPRVLAANFMALAAVYAVVFLSRRHSRGDG